ncbi:ribonuclease activity regulator RraA [Flagellimonas sp. DF-77]|uniref:ribonuclease activity regulator RraA n=1 Tax=Flagellimonas algarum TaxID=3230298 RepID=UPI0033955EB3
MEKVRFEQLGQISTATLTTCLFKRGLRNQFLQNVQAVKDYGKPMVGRAVTLRYIPAREDLNPISVFKDPDHPQRVAIEQCGPGDVLVIDSRKDARAASAGSILVTRLLRRGAAGIVTDGGFRDSREIANSGFPAFHQRPSAPTNLTLHQAIAINEPIGCGDVAVFPGDYIVGDADGVVVIPAAEIDAVIQEGLEMTLFETFVTEQVDQGASIKGLYPPTDPDHVAAFSRWKQNLPSES